MIYMFLADGFEECEALAPLDILRRSGVEIKTVGIGGKEITGAHSVTVTADLYENEICLNDDLAAVILPGGMPGTLNLEKSETVKSSLLFMHKENRLICAICAAPKILGGMGLLKGEKATCYPGYEKDFQGGEYIKASVVKSGSFITASGPGAAFRFGFEILRHFKGNEAVEKLQNAMQFNV